MNLGLPDESKAKKKKKSGKSDSYKERYFNDIYDEQNC